jgi:serine phosphatase RsbU (regulator of sigma subunit)
MACMEVWGGCDAADGAVTLSGLDAWVYARPYQRAEAGGDVYYVSSCAAGMVNRLLVADVSGHGPTVRGTADQLRDLMRRYINYLDQSAFVRAMNRHFVECSAPGCFATALVTTFAAPTGTLSVCNAGHPVPLLWQTGTREWSTLDHATDGRRCLNVPLGIEEYDACEQFDVTLETGDLVLIYTDSLIECCATDGQPLGLGGLLALVRQELDPDDPAALIPALLQAIDRRTPGGLDADDVTLLLLRANGTRPPVGWWVNLRASMRILASVGRALAGRGPMALPDHFSMERKDAPHA